MTAFANDAGGARLREALADELVLASRRLADLAFDLASNGETLRRHMTSLQEIDHVTQIQLTVANVLRNGADGLTNVGLEDLLRRMESYR